ncbi:hypothetical protein F511_00794 [Dorcoceras hygrometricum]|nr:hypothetical protein F511_00794 [Dorcoceras hygrometricum]
MNLGDLNKVWEIKTLKRKTKEEEAQKILDGVAKQVQPIMRNHNWRVKILSEFCPKNPALLGLNVGRGIHIKLRLRRPNRDDEFIPFHEVLDTMLHELCHNVHGPHNSSFYKLWDEIRKECEDFINKGISGTGQGFDLPGKRLGGSRLKPSSSLRQATLTAAENRARLGKLLPSGPKHIGADSAVMVSLSPIQAAAMAAEMRLRDNIWCGSEFCDDCEYDENTNPSPNSADGYDNKNQKAVSHKRSHESDSVSSLHSSSGHLDSSTSDSSHPIKKPFGSTCPKECTRLSQSSRGDQSSIIVDFSGEPSTSLSMCSHEKLHDDKHNMWPCAVCTLLNQVPKETKPDSYPTSCLDMATTPKLSAIEEQFHDFADMSSTSVPLKDGHGNNEQQHVLEVEQGEEQTDNAHEQNLKENMDYSLIDAEVHDKESPPSGNNDDANGELTAHLVQIEATKL